MKKSVGIWITLFILLIFTNFQASALAADLIAGRNADVVGNVSVSKEGDFLHIKYTINDSNWCMTNTHLHVAPSFESIPQTKSGNPIPGRFDYRGTLGYSTEGIVCGVEYSYMIQLFGATGMLYIAAHADVINQMNQKGEAAWGDGIEFPGGNWATYFTYVVPAPGPIPR